MRIRELYGGSYRPQSDIFWPVRALYGVLQHLEFTWCRTYIRLPNLERRISKQLIIAKLCTVYGTLVMLNYIFVLFADDTNLFYCNKSIEVLEQIVKNELDLLYTWFRANKQVSHVKFLGVYLDELLNWAIHINDMSNKVAKILAYFVN